MRALQPVRWMRLIVLASAGHGFYAAAFGPGTIEGRALGASLSLGLMLAALHPLRYWPAVAAGLAGRVLIPLSSAIAGRSLPLEVILADAIWWAPLGYILAAAYCARLNRLRDCAPGVLCLALRAKTNRGISLDALSRQSPVLLVFLRQTGCTFCREALADIAAQRREIEASGTTIVLAHMLSPERSRQVLGKYGLNDLHQACDPDRALYRAFGLRCGGLRMLFGPKVWWRGFGAAVLDRHGIGRPDGNGSQMPGVFMIFHGQVIRSYRHQSVADRPDYARFLNEDAITRVVS